MALIDLPTRSPGAGPSGATNTPAPIGRNLDSCECNAGSRLESPIESADRLTFWRNWYIASRQLPDNIRLAWYDAVLDFAFEGKEPQLPVGDSMQVADAVAFQAVAMVRATIDISRKRKQIGSKGGSKRQANRKQTPSKPQANAKQTASKPQANAKQTPSKPQANAKQEQEQEQVQEQEQEHNANSITATTREKQLPTVDQFVDAGKLAGVPEDFARPFYAELVAAGWQDADGLHVANWRRYLKSAWRDEQKKFPGARGSQPAGGIALDDIPDVR